MRFESAIVGIDFNETARVAARWLTSCFSPSADVTLVHVCDPDDVPPFARPLLPARQQIEMARRDRAETEIQKLVSALAPRVVRYEIRAGKPYEQIPQLAQEIGADLIVVGPHGDASPSRLLGTTAERIVRISHVPVLVATHPPSAAPRNILVPIDDDAIAHEVLSCASDLAKQFDAAVTLLHVWSNAEYSYVASMSRVTTKSDEAARSEIAKEMHTAATHWLEELARTGIAGDRVNASIAYGKPGVVTLETAAAIDADLIVLGRRSSGLVGPALLGGTLRTVLHGATCPVLVVTERRDESVEN